MLFFVGTWGSIDLRLLDLNLPMSDVYAGVTFKPAETEKMTVEVIPSLPPRYTLEEYPATEEKSEVRHECIDQRRQRHDGLWSVMTLPSLDIEVRLVDIHEGVELKPCEPSMPDPLIRACRSKARACGYFLAGGADWVF